MDDFSQWWLDGDSWLCLGQQTGRQRGDNVGRLSVGLQGRYSEVDRRVQRVCVCCRRERGRRRIDLFRAKGLLGWLLENELRLISGRAVVFR
ncbi:hypothetical protein CASFOL_034845 [Castilleja foliolosa]|uniref:Uncharacterized protein n=1 Tax=Castilleja foliolosa TaxID=1961234 RepID=A0ABD3BR03_9LAMI